MVSDSIPEVRKLSRSEKWLLMSELWDSLVSEGEDPAVPDAHKAILDECLEEHAKDPRAGASWVEVKARILKS